MTLTHLQATAIEAFVLRVTIPIFFDACAEALLLGTGTLFETSGSSFLITARHIFDDVHDFTKLSCPESPLRGIMHTFGSLEVLKPAEEHIDIAVLKLRCPNAIKRLKSNWRFLGMENITPQYPGGRDSHFFVSGFPSSLSVIQPASSQCKLVTAYTNPLQSVPDEALMPIITGLDLFFEYGKDAISIQGEIIDTPKLQGMSGSSVWKLAPVEGVWTPEKAARVIGIQSAFNHSRYIRAKSWIAVKGLLNSAGYCFPESITGHH